MTPINWLEEVEKRKEELIQKTQELIRIPSVLDEKSAKPGAPFGPEVAKALHYTLDLCAENGMKTKNLEGYIGHAEFGEGEEIVGILCHVDVVPPGDGWSVDPFGGEIREGKLIARGANDDKGPTMAAIFAAKIVKELGLPLKRRVRLIIGADEESNWRCVDKYFAEEEMPALGFAPDADFPLIHAEKGLYNIRVQMELNRSREGSIQLIRFDAGQRSNMVPDLAKAILRVEDTEVQQRIKTQFQTYIKAKGRPGKVIIQGNELTLSSEGISVHGSTPDQGVHAGWVMVHFLHTLELDEQGAIFMQLLMDKFVDDYSGEKFGIAVTDDVLGPLTMNVGIIQYPAKEDDEWQLAINIRYPTNGKQEILSQKISKQLDAYQCRISLESKGLPPHYVGVGHPLVKTLMRIYQEQTGDLQSKPIAIGGATYARSLKAGVAFGALFPARPDSAHQKDEFFYMDDLMKATAIYAQAIYELANICVGVKKEKIG